jgi:aminoglycoside phosphotransferase (APT) family kinase protein
MIVVPAQAGTQRPERSVAMEVDTTLVRKLLRDQFPRWADLDVRPIEPGGWDNRSLRLGDELVARFPSDEAYASQVEKEYHWLPRLAPHLPLAIPTPIAMGAPGPGYPWCWSIYDWIDGDAASSTSRVNPLLVATDLARFLGALQCIDPQGGPSPGTHNFHRGGDLRVYDDEVDRALAVLDGAIDRRAAGDLWKKAVATRWRNKPVWIHGDVSPGNLLLRSGRLNAVIDFGNLAVGDPACDLAIGWSWFDRETCEALRTALPLDDDAWLRGRAWALWKALVVAAGMSPTNAVEYADPMRAVQRCLAD